MRCTREQNEMKVMARILTSAPITICINIIVIKLRETKRCDTGWQNVRKMKYNCTAKTVRRISRRPDELKRFESSVQGSQVKGLIYC